MRSRRSLPSPRALLRALVTRVLSTRSSPARIGWAVAIGIVIGTSPFYGLHLAITLVVAAVLGLNPVITYLAASISIPPVAPLLALGSIQIGTLVLTGDVLPLTLESVRRLDPWTFFESWMLGSLILGTILGAPAGVATYLGVRVHRRRHPLPPDRIADLMAAVANRYRHDRFTFGYVRGKLAQDPVYRRLVEHGQLAAPLVDLGCGRGQASVLLASSRPDLPILGIDSDRRKLEHAWCAAAGLERVRFEEADVRTAPIPEAGTILLIDVLHYLPPEAQDRVLERAARALAPGGTLFVREIDGAAGWRARLNAFQERLGRLVGLNRGATLAVRPAADLIAVLEAAGLRVVRTSSAAGLGAANVLLEAQRAR